MAQMLRRAPDHEPWIGSNLPAEARLRTYNYSNRKNGAAAHQAGRRSTVAAACRAYERSRRDEHAAWPPHTIESRAQRAARGAAPRPTAANFKQNPMWRAISDLFSWTGKLVRLLRNAQPMIRNRTRTSREWKAGADYRVICDCQRHARRQQALWRRSLRAASQFKKSGAVLLVGLPLALGMAGIPMEGTTDGAVPSAPAIASAVSVRPQRANAFRIFTDKVRTDFLDPQHDTRTLTLEVTKEEFFRTRVPYGSIIYREATKNQLAPELVAAVVEAESDFRPRLISGKNAQGLMQIVPSTGELLGAGNLFDPEQNIAAGSKYLKYLIDRFGDLHLALAAYNAGEGNIEKFGGVPPFPETQNYVQRVSAHTRWYRQRVRESFLASSRISTTYTR
jgi:hypothetical protein